MDLNDIIVNTSNLVNSALARDYQRTSGFHKSLVNQRKTCKKDIRDGLGLDGMTILIGCINRFTSLCKNLFNLLEFLAEAFRCHVHHFQCLRVPVELASAKNSSKLKKFLHSEVNLLIQHIIVQDQDGQNNNNINSPKKIGINTRNCVGSAQDRDYWRAQFGIEPPGSISH